MKKTIAALAIALMALSTTAPTAQAQTGAEAIPTVIGGSLGGSGAIAAAVAGVLFLGIVLSDDDSSSTTTTNN